MRYLFVYLFRRVNNLTIHSTTTNIQLSNCIRKQSTMLSHPQALLLSSSNCHGFSMLEFAKSVICSVLKKHNIEDIIFVPYAQTDYDKYTKSIKEVIEPWGFSVTGIHTFSDPINAINSTRAIFVGGGNTFLLLNSLYENKLVKLIKEKVYSGELVYIGSSAGTNVATISIHTTNDMPIIYPPTFEAIGIVPFNINPHYIDKIEAEKHKGETRDQRINEYMDMAHAKPVLGLKEGCILHVDGKTLTLKGVAGAVLFTKDAAKAELPVESDVSFLCFMANDARNAQIGAQKQKYN